MGGPSQRAERLVLAVDLGTGGPKVGFVALGGHTIWSDVVPAVTTYGGRRGDDDRAASQDAGLWWVLIRDTAKRGLRTAGIDGRQVVGVAVTGQWASTVPVDEDGRPTGPCLMWMDTRGAPHVRRAIGGPMAGYGPLAAAMWLRRNGGIPALGGDDCVGHMLYLLREEPEIASATRWFMEPVDYLTMCFTGRAVASPASMMGSWLTDTRDPAAVRYDRHLVRMAGLDLGKLPSLVPTGSIVGAVKPAVAEDLGISPDAQVVTGTPDLHTAVTGSGAVRPGELHLTISTTSWISCPTPRKKTDIRHQMTTVPGIEPANYLIVNNQDTAGRALQWMRENILVGFDYDGLNSLARGAEPGSGGVIFTPWLKGEHSPIDDRNARGGFHNLSLSTTHADLVRSVLEGVAYNSRWLLGAVDGFAGIPTSKTMRVVGGGAQSPLWCQIMADVCDRTVEQVSDPLNAQLRGAALLAGVGMGEVRLDELDDLVGVDAVFTPNSDRREIYDRLFAEVPKLYKGQKGVFARLNG